MRILYSQKDGEQYLSRRKFRDITYPVTGTFRSSKLLTKIFFYKRKSLMCVKCKDVTSKETLNSKRFIIPMSPEAAKKQDIYRGMSIHYQYGHIDTKKHIKARTGHFAEQGACSYCGSKDFEERWAGSGTRGNFRSFADHGFYNNERKLFEQGIRGVITLKLWPDITPAELFSVYAHEFFHWRQSCAAYYGRGRYSEKKAYKWQKKMTNKYYPKHHDERWGK